MPDFRLGYAEFWHKYFLTFTVFGKNVRKKAPIFDHRRYRYSPIFLILLCTARHAMHTLRRPDNQQPQPQSLPQPQLPKPPQSNRMIIKITIQEDPQPQPLLQPQPITVVPPFAFLNHTMKDGKRCDKGRRKAAHIPYAAPLRPTLILLYYTIPPLTPNT